MKPHERTTHPHRKMLPKHTPIVTSLCLYPICNLKKSRVGKLSHKQI